MDWDLRKLRYFVAVADRLNFGRAAEALHIAQPVLSRQILALEHELKAQLFERDNRTTRLTPAGKALLDEARPLLSAADAVHRAQPGVPGVGQRSRQCPHPRVRRDRPCRGNQWLTCRHAAGASAVVASRSPASVEAALAELPVVSAGRAVDASSTADLATSA
jgi:hypothetical protein